MGVKIDLAYVTTSKHASRESGDTIDIVERPAGGVAIVLVDGQGSGRPAKSLSSQVMARVIGAIKDGARDGAAARLANDALFTHRDGKVSATLDLLTVDPKSARIALHRYSPVPFIAACGTCIEPAGAEGSPLGLYYQADPLTWEWPLVESMRIVLASDGIVGSGYRKAMEPLDLADWLEPHLPACTARQLADDLLQTSLERDDRRPGDDMSAIVLCVHSDSTSMLIRSGSTLVPLP